jgi:alanine-synthesizing transaminase
VVDGVAASRHLAMVTPMGALYGFPQVVGDAATGFDDQAFALEMLESEGVLIVPGTSFNMRDRDHFRVTLLPQPDVLAEVFARIERVLDRRADAASSPTAQVA